MESKMPSLAGGGAYSLKELYAQYLEACTATDTPSLPLHTFKIILTKAFQSRVQIIADASNTLEIVLLKTMSVIAELNELASLRKAVRNSKTKLNNTTLLGSSLASFQSAGLLLFEFLEEISSTQNKQLDSSRLNGEVKFHHKWKQRESPGFNMVRKSSKNVHKGSLELNGLCLAYEGLYNFLHILIKGCFPEDDLEFMDSALFGEIARLVEELARLQLLYREPTKAPDQAGSGVQLVYNGSEHSLSPLPPGLSAERLLQLIKARLRLSEDSQVCVSFYDDFSKRHLVLDCTNVKCIEGKTLLVELSDHAPRDRNADYTSTPHVPSKEGNGQQQFSDGGQCTNRQNKLGDDHGTESTDHSGGKHNSRGCKVAAEQGNEELSTSGSVDEEGLCEEEDELRQSHCQGRKNARHPRSTLLPTNFHIPVHIFPPTLLARISEHQQLIKPDLCQVITAVFRHVVTTVPYPTRSQYCQIINALFRSLPGLLQYSQSYDQAYSEWKQRLSHKFRNCRRKDKYVPKRPRPQQAVQYGRRVLPYTVTARKNGVIEAVLSHKNENHNLTLDSASVSLDALLSLIHRQLDIPQYVALRVLLQEGAKCTPVTQHNVHLVSGKHLVVEIDDHADGNADMPELPVDAILKPEDDELVEIQIKLEPEETGCKENARKGFASSAFTCITDAADSNTPHEHASVGCEPDIDFLSPTTRIEIEEDDVSNVEIKEDENKEIDVSDSVVDLDSIENCDLVKHEIVRFEAEGSDQFSTDYGDYGPHEFVSMEDLKNETPEPALRKRRYRCRGAPLPPDFSVPTSVFPPLLTARVARRLPLTRSDFCRITSALFSYVVTQLPYPSPNQYSEIICALFAALPGLLSYSDCLEAAHSEWKYRLSHKFRNCRRKKNNKSKSRPKNERNTSFPNDGSSPTDELFPHDDAALSLWASEGVFPFGSTNEEAVLGAAAAIRSADLLRVARSADTLDCVSGHALSTLLSDA